MGRSFLMDEQPDGQKARGKIVQLIEDHESSLEDNPTRIRFRVSVNNDKAEEIIMYNKMLEYITRDEESDIMWKFQDYSRDRMGEWGDHQRTPKHHCS
jgi:hypothetical protein